MNDQWPWINLSRIRAKFILRCIILAQYAIFRARTTQTRDLFPVRGNMKMEHVAEAGNR